MSNRAVIIGFNFLFARFNVAIDLLDGYFLAAIRASDVVIFIIAIEALRARADILEIAQGQSIGEAFILRRIIASATRAIAAVRAAFFAFTTGYATHALGDGLFINHRLLTAVRAADIGETIIARSVGTASGRVVNSEGVVGDAFVGRRIVAASANAAATIRAAFFAGAIRDASLAMSIDTSMLARRIHIFIQATIVLAGGNIGVGS